MHPDKYKTQMLALSLEPTALKVYNTSTYKVQSVCTGGTSAGGRNTARGGGSAVFCRAALSADGRIVACGTTSSNDEGCSRLRFWDSQTGNALPSTLTDLLLPFAVRSISWHPKQHVMAVAMIGSGAAVALYSGQRESAEKAVARINQSAAASMSLALVVDPGEPFEPVPQGPNPLLNTSIDSTSSVTARNRIETARLKNQAMGYTSDPPSTKDPPMRSISDLPPVKESIRSLRSEKAREILEKIRAAKGQ